MQDENGDEVLAVLRISPESVNLDVALLEAQDLAWEHAKEIAAEARIGLGSEEFADMYLGMQERYGHQVEHLKFFMLTSLITIRELLQSNLLAIPGNDDGSPLTGEQATEYITNAAQCLTGSYMWLSASHETFWPLDEDINSNTAVAFYFDEHDIEFPEEEL